MNKSLDHGNGHSNDLKKKKQSHDLDKSQSENQIKKNSSPSPDIQSPNINTLKQSTKQQQHVNNQQLTKNKPAELTNTNQVDIVSNKSPTSKAKK